jgi:hypothetical protein
MISGPCFYECMPQACGRCYTLPSHNPDLSSLDPHQKMIAKQVYHEIASQTTELAEILGRVIDEASYVMCDHTRLRYWRWSEFGFKWTPDLDTAIRFSRVCDANAVCYDYDEVRYILTVREARALKEVADLVQLDQ